MRTLAVLVGLLVAGSAGAQTVTNPTSVQFTVSADHAQVTKYAIGYYTSATATAPVQETDLGTGVPAADGTLTMSINVQPLAFGVTWVARVRAWAGSAASEWSEASNVWSRVPGKPGKPAPK